MKGSGLDGLPTNCLPLSSVGSATVFKDATTSPPLFSPLDVIIEIDEGSLYHSLNTLNLTSPFPLEKVKSGVRWFVLSSVWCLPARLPLLPPVLRRLVLLRLVLPIVFHLYAVHIRGRLAPVRPTNPGAIDDILHAQNRDLPAVALYSRCTDNNAKGKKGNRYIVRAVVDCVWCSVCALITLLKCVYKVALHDTPAQRRITNARTMERLNDHPPSTHAATCVKQVANAGLGGEAGNGRVYK